MKTLTVIGMAALAATGCAGTRTAQPPPEPLFAGPCSGYLTEVSEATSASRARATVKDYLGCLVADGVPPPDLKLRIKAALHANPYPGTRRNANRILSFFFDKSLLKELPEDRRALMAYIDMLDAQALRAKAEGDTRFAAAAEKRAKALTTIRRTVELLDQEG